VTNLSDQYDRDVVVIGGGGHVGLPLAIAFADRGVRVAVYDVSETAVAMVNAGQMPFAEPGADEVLQRVLAAGRLEASADPAIVSTAENVVVVIGTAAARSTCATVSCSSCAARSSRA
jgi:UDP-N-acetyl-D-mannosaminuronic acid dehydrogenase